MCNLASEGGRCTGCQSRKAVRRLSAVYDAQPTDDTRAALVEAHVVRASTSAGLKEARKALAEGTPGPGGLPASYWQTVIERGEVLAERERALAGLGEAEPSTRPVPAPRTLADTVVIISDGLIEHKVGQGNPEFFSGERHAVTVQTFDRAAYTAYVDADSDDVPEPRALSEHGPMRYSDAVDSVRHAVNSPDLMAGLDRTARRAPGNDWSGVLNPVTRSAAPERDMEALLLSLSAEGRDYERRVAALEGQGLDRSDAQAAVEAQDYLAARDSARSAATAAAQGFSTGPAPTAAVLMASGRPLDPTSRAASAIEAARALDLPGARKPRGNPAQQAENCAKVFVEDCNGVTGQFFMTGVDRDGTIWLRQIDPTSGLPTGLQWQNRPGDLVEVRAA